MLKLLKMAKGIRSLLDTVMHALPQVGNLGLLFYLLFFIFAALGVELFGRLGTKLLDCKTSDPPSASTSQLEITFCFLVVSLCVLLAFSACQNATTTIRARDSANTLTLPTLESLF